jgi:hypothetical protein
MKDPVRQRDRRTLSARGYLGQLTTQITPFQCLNLNVGSRQNLPIAYG